MIMAVPKLKIILLVSLSFFIFPIQSLAHGGVSKNVGNTVVYLNQSPLSPRLGDEVQLSFAFRDKDNKNLSHLPVILSVIDTYFGDALKDQEVGKQQLTTDVNGDLDFSYKLTKTDYFDVELTFKDPVDGKDDTTGFLIQAQKGYSQTVVLLGVFLGIIVGLVIGFFLFRIRKNSAIIKA
jgi:hypothetical protein